MRTRTAKKLAQRIDLNYFKQAHGMRRLRMVLSLAVPAIGLLWLGGLAAAGSRAPYSSGPVSSAHAFAENKCEVCHQPAASFRSHVADKACLTCHDGPAHTATHPLPLPTPDCASCHREHQGRVQLAATVPDQSCVSCHADLSPSATPKAPAESAQAPAPWVAASARPGPWPTTRRVEAFPAVHPEFAVLREAFKDPGRIRFNHQVHASENLRGPDGPEKLECTSCHRPELARTARAAKRVGNLMGSVTFDQQCARCHGLFFDERIEKPAPHGHPRQLRPFIEAALREYIAANPNALSERTVRRLPLNFARDPEPVARTPQEWVAKRAARAQMIVERACSFCHGVAAQVDGPDYGGPIWPVASIQKEWMPRATFDHAPHLMVQCTSCHNAEKSRETSDVLMPTVATCATCHAPGKGAPAQCITCHGYHDWTKAQPVKPHFTLTDFQ